MSKVKKSEKYKVCIDDNYHYMDESERYTAGTYKSLKKAVEKCKKITIRSLEDLYEKGITPEKLSAQWSMFGEDPFIVGSGGSVPFSARKFVTTELCKAIIDSHKIANREKSISWLAWPIDQHMTEDYRKISFWLDSEPGSLEPRPSLETTIDADVAIIGAGYTGLWTAYYLKKIDPAMEHRIVESKIAGYGASGRNGGWCSAYLAGIGHWLDDPNSRDDAIRLQRLLFDTVKEVSRVTEEESIDCHFEQSGALEIAVNAMQQKRLRKEIDYYHNLGFTDEDYRWLDVDEISKMPAMEGAQAAIHMAHTAAIHPARLARGLAARLQNMGVAIYEHSTVTGIGPNQLTTMAGSVNTGSIIIATEGYSNNTARRKNQLIPLHSMMVATEPLSAAQLDELRMHKRYCFSSIHHLVTYGQLTADNRIAFGCRGSYHYGSRIRQFTATDTDFNAVRESLLQLFPSLNGISFTHAWGGAMGVARNLHPSVNYSRAKGLGWAGGYFGNGVGASNLAGRTMADLITGRDTDRSHTPWVNPHGTGKHWEPEPLRWLAIKSAKSLMHMADKCEERNSRLTPIIQKALAKVWS